MAEPIDRPFEEPPTTEEVVDVLTHTRGHFMRKPQRDVIRRLLRHRDSLVEQLAEMRANNEKPTDA